MPGWESVRLDGRRLRLPAGSWLDLGATAKGLGSDRAAGAAATAITGGGVLVSLGGDIAVAGEAPLGGWPVLVGRRAGAGRAGTARGRRAAAGAGRPAGQVVRLAAGALATSSIMCRRWRRGGRLLHHIVDPRTGLPAAGPWRTVSVAAANCAEANAASTAAIIAGDQAPAWLAGQGLPARLVAHDGSVRFVSGWPEDEGGQVEAPRIGRMSAGTAPPRRRPGGRAGHGGPGGAGLGRSSSQYLWFLSRGSGLVLLVLFSAVVVLGVATRTGSAPGRWPRFAVAELHRTLSLFAVALLVLHVVTAILDPFVTIGWAATLLPLASPYRTLAIGLGTLAVDLGGAVLVTSLMRRRLGQRAWRAVHWLAYLAWPAAFAPLTDRGQRPRYLVGGADRGGLRRGGGGGRARPVVQPVPGRPARAALPGHRGRGRMPSCSRRPGQRRRAHERRRQRPA